jgi:uncharacterized membrane protein
MLSPVSEAASVHEIVSGRFCDSAFNRSGHMGVFETALVISTLLCALVAGFVFAFASVVMPGIQDFDDREYLRTFKAMDLVIQRNQPPFVLVWLGSVLTLLITVLLGFWHLAGMDRLLLMVAGATYLFGVQLPTATINVPLNNWLQKLELDSLGDSEIHEARVRFEDRWIKWNLIRTILAVSTTALLIFLLLRL